MFCNIIFDIGNVLTDFRWKGFLEDKGFDEETVERIARASVLTPLWSELDRGVWDMERMIQEFSKMDPELEPQLYRAFDNVTGIVTKRDYAIPWIEKLKAEGYGVYYLSNFYDKAYVECADALDFLPYMDGGILSYLEKIVKPDAEIYRRLLDRYELTAKECIFIDDTKANVETAVALGMQGIRFRNREQAVEELKILGVRT